MYAIGKGVPQDYMLAYMWFNLASSRDSAWEKEKQRHKVERPIAWRGSGSRRRRSEHPHVARTARAIHLRNEGIGRTYRAQTSVSRSRSRRRGDGLLCYCCRPQWFQVNPLPDMRTDRRSGIRRSNRDSSWQGNSMELPVWQYTGSPNKALHSACAYREGVSLRCRIALTCPPQIGPRRVNARIRSRLP